MPFQTISFSLMTLLVSAAAIQFLWNRLLRDFTSLPRLTYGKAVGVVVLWGLLFILVLTMISGARELMTPGAWQKQGFTYKLPETTPAAVEPSPLTLRKQNLERLRTVLLHYAATHKGQFPAQSEVLDLAPELWELPESAGL